MALIINQASLNPPELGTGRTRQWLAHQQMGTTHTALFENYFTPGGYVPAHYHRTEELLVCLEGLGQIIMQDKKYDFPAGSTAIIPALAIHEVRNMGDGQMRMLAFFAEADPDTVWQDGYAE